MKSNNAAGTVAAQKNLADIYLVWIIGKISCPLLLVPDNAAHCTTRILESAVLGKRLLRSKKRFLVFSIVRRG